MRSRHSERIAAFVKHSVLAASVLLAACGDGHDAAKAGIPQAKTECGAALDALMALWHAIDFPEPSKPAQMIVAGRGYTTTGGQFGYLRTMIRMAARDCADGHESESMARIAKVREILEHDRSG